MESINIQLQENPVLGKPGKAFKQPDYYFHPDEDFKEDRDWGKQKTVAFKAISSPADNLKYKP